MGNPSSQHEPTMEEILASIRKIISEDSPESAQAQTVTDEAAEEPAVLDLTQEISEEIVESSSTTPAPPPPPSTESAPARTAREPVDAATKETAVSNHTHSSEGIFSDKSRKTLSDVFNGLAPQQPEQVAPVEGLPIEAVFERAVREAFEPVLQKWLTDNADTIIERMKPTIGEWLDEHFPAMLEDAVRNEVARAVKARGRR